MSETCFNNLHNEIDHLMDKVSELQVNLEDLRSKAEDCEETYKKDFEDVERDAACVKDAYKDRFDTLKEIIEQAENEDYGIKRWRTLTTKQDLIAAIKEEVLDV